MAWVEDVGGARDAARLLDCSTVSVYKWLSGERRPRPELAEKIEELSGGSVSKEEWFW